MYSSDGIFKPITAENSSVSKQTAVHHSDTPLRYMFIQCPPANQKIFNKKKKKKENL